VNPNWVEGSLEFDFSGAVDPVEKPDRPAQPLKSVDFVAKYARELWLIEVKDPDAAPAPQQRGAINAMIAGIQNDELLKQHLLPKIYGTFVYLVQNRREPRGRVRYGVLIGLTALTAADRAVLTDKLQRVIDRVGPKVRHSRMWPIAEVHNVASWNGAHPDMAITRHP
jgi:gamma-glutamyl:cysteine ligase YbdK (ATP-grasp superfamily)